MPGGRLLERSAVRSVSHGCDTHKTVMVLPLFKKDLYKKKKYLHSVHFGKTSLRST